MMRPDHDQVFARQARRVDSKTRKACAARGRGLRASFTLALIIAVALSLALMPRARADEMSDLKETVKKLEARVQALEAEKAAAKEAAAKEAAAKEAAAKAAPAATAAEAKAPIAKVEPLPAAAAAPYVPPPTVKGDQDAVQRVDNAVLDPALKGFFKIPGTDTIMKVGGYVKLDMIYDTKPIGTFDYFVTSAIPTSGPQTAFGSQFTVQAKQTRLNVDLRRDTELGPARLYFETDLFGNASSNFQPGTYQFQLRHAFGMVKNFAGGYSFSAFMDNDALPDTLDFEGPGSAPFLLLAQGRYIGKINDHSSLSVSVEAPNSQVTVPNGGGKSIAPDVSLRARYDAEAGHVQLSGVYRRLGWISNTGDAQYTNGYGLNLAGSLKTGIGDDYLVAGGVWGKGIARYVSDITGSGLDAVVDPSNNNLVALQEYGGYGGYTHYWTPKLRSTAVVNYLGMSNKSFQSGTSFTNSQYYSANLIWNPWGSVNVGVELLYGRYKTFDGLSANDTRIQMSAQYDFVR